MEMRVVVLLLMLAAHVSATQKVACSGTSVDFLCPEGSVIWISRVQYGQPDLDDPLWGSCKIPKTSNCTVEDVTDDKLAALQEMCNNERKCSFKVNQNQVGDRCGYKWRIAIIDWMCAAKIQATFCKGDRAEVTCPDGLVVSLDRVQSGQPPVDDPAWAGCEQHTGDQLCPFRPVTYERLTELQEQCNNKCGCRFKVNKKQVEAYGCGKGNFIATPYWKCVPVVRLIPPVLDLHATEVNQDLTLDGGPVMAQQDHGALLGLGGHRVCKVDMYGNILYAYNMTVDSQITNIVYHKRSAYIQQFDGTLTQLDMDDLTFQQNYTLDPYAFQGTFLEDGRFITCPDECFAYNLTTGEKEVITRNVYIYQVIKAVNNNTEVRYIASLPVQESLQVFSDQLEKLFTIGDGQLFQPTAIESLCDGTILVAEKWHLSEFSSSGEFVRELLTFSWIPEGFGNGIFSISFKHPYLWISSIRHPFGDVRRYKLYA